MKWWRPWPRGVRQCLAPLAGLVWLLVLLGWVLGALGIF